MKKPLIGISTSFDDESKAYKLYFNYCALINKAGGDAVLLPYGFTSFDALDGVIISGGGDVDGALGGYENTPVVDGINHERDAFEMKLFSYAFEKGLPVLGICRGHQLLNVSLKGTLHRDIKEAGFTEEHQIGSKGAHTMHTKEGSLMREMYGESAEIWSTHHQAVREAGAGLTVTARSPEGVVEAVEHENGRVLGIQSHPERMDFLPPFAWLVGKAKRG